MAEALSSQQELGKEFFSQVPSLLERDGYAEGGRNTKLLQLKADKLYTIVFGSGDINMIYRLQYSHDGNGFVRLGDLGGIRNPLAGEQMWDPAILEKISKPQT